MKCNCSSINNYEIIGFCDIEKFNEKITEFNDKSWVQVSISDNSIHLGNRPSIKTITKTFVDVKINSVKLINTPKSQQTSIEGLKLTGKSLLIVGEITQKILYTSNSCNSHRINSFNIKSPFTTHMVVNQNVDIAKDKFCIYTCIEYSSIRHINECTLNQNVTLFLFAHRTTPAPSYPNEIISNNGSDQKVVQISFSTDNNKIKIASTGKKLDSGNPWEWGLMFYLVNSAGEIIKRGVVANGMDGTKFKSSLDNTEYSIGDIVYISTGSKNSKHTKITNYPTLGETYSLVEDFERFEITNNGFVKINSSYPNEITLKTRMGDIFGKLIFPFDTKAINIIDVDYGIEELGSQGIIIEVKLYASDGTTEKNTATLKGEEKINKFLSDIAYKAFEYGDIIEINSTNSQNRIEISNFPDDGRIYTPREAVERFRIGFDRFTRA